MLVCIQHHLAAGIAECLMLLLLMVVVVSLLPLLPPLPLTLLLLLLSLAGAEPGSPWCQVLLQLAEA